MKKYSLEGGSSFLDREFPFSNLDYNEIKEIDARIAASAVAQENIDNPEHERDQRDQEEASASTDSKTDGGTVIGSINIHIGDNNHFHNGGVKSDDNVVDVDYVDVDEQTIKQPIKIEDLHFHFEDEDDDFLN